MKRKFIAFLTALVILVALPMTVFAAEALSYVVDAAGLFSSEERDALEAKVLALRDTYEMDVVILTVDSLDGSRPQDYADDYFDSRGYGYSGNYSGMLFLLAMEERELYVSTSGDARYVLTDYGIEVTTEVVLPYFGSEDYYGGFDAWLDTLPEYFDAFQNGNPIDSQVDYSDGYYHGDQEEMVYYEEDVTPSFFLSVIIGIIVAAIAVLIMRIGMNTKRPQRSAADYLIPGSYQLRKEKDVFLYSRVSKTARPQQTNSGSSGGGSSVHTSSSGRSHGGGGRKF